MVTVTELVTGFVKSRVRVLVPLATSPVDKLMPVKFFEAQNPLSGLVGKFAERIGQTSTEERKLIIKHTEDGCLCEKYRRLSKEVSPWFMTS
ncbi:hypothetical protein TNCV_3383491 [Trichonephila clavipes]|nr:hypothetical protein TNCV_3383491 [Trichonephila clavipes]